MNKLDQTDKLTTLIKTFEKLDAEVEVLMKAAEEGRVCVEDEPVVSGDGLIMVINMNNVNN